MILKMVIPVWMMLTNSSPDIMRVEEDWEIVLNMPDADIDAPQFHTLISPFDNLDSLFVQHTWNYREMPDYQAGGLQLQVWNDDEMLAKKNIERYTLSTYAETILWTQILSTTGTHIYNSIENGESVTWGEFGGSSMSVVGEWAVSNLNQYSPDFSVANSWISYGDNRVELFRIKEVRYYDADNNLISTDTTSHVVFVCAE